MPRPASHARGLQTRPTRDSPHSTPPPPMDVCLPHAQLFSISPPRAMRATPLPTRVPLLTRCYYSSPDVGRLAAGRREPGIGRRAPAARPPGLGLRGAAAAWSASSQWRRSRIPTGPRRTLNRRPLALARNPQPRAAADPARIKALAPSSRERMIP